MSGQWPPEWEDPDDEHADAGLPDQEHLDAGDAGLRLSEVTALLASVRSPALPASFEARISAAIAAEAAARAATGPSAATEPADPPMAANGAGDAKDTVRSANLEEFSAAAASAGPATPADRRPGRSAQGPRSTGPGNPRPDGRRRRLRMPSTQAASWVLVCCLALAGFGFLVSHGGSSSSSSEAASASSGQVPSPAAGGAGLPDNTLGGQQGTQPEHAADEPTAVSSASGTSGPTSFLVYSTGTAFKQLTLASQVRGLLDSDVYGSLSTSATAVAPAASASSSAANASGAAGSAPSTKLSGCVSRLTDGATPSLVDKASYDGAPAYIIAEPTQVWVVGLGCSAADTHLIVRIPLKG